MEQNGCNLLLHDTKNSALQIKQQLDKILESGSDGVLLQPNTVDDPDVDLLPVLEKFRAMSIPVVLVCGIFAAADFKEIFRRRA